MEIKELNSEHLFEENIRLNNELNKTNNELVAWKEYTQKIMTLLKTFKNDYEMMHAKCIQCLGNSNDNIVEGFNEFLRGKLHTITEVINDIQIIHSIKFIDGTNYEEGQEEEKNEPLLLLTQKDIEERENGKIMDFFRVDYII
jgi:hypoxanthine-guanine phosphoribosyltransferase